MWDSIRLSLTGNFSLRKMILVFVAGLMSALFVSLGNSTTTFAATATWDGDSIKVGNDTYTKVSESTVIPNIGADRSAYATQPVDGIVKVLSLPRDPDKTKEIPDVTQYEFKYDEQTKTYSEPRQPTRETLTIAASAADPAAEEERTSCGIKSIGWILCSTSRFLASAMDRVYDWISRFLVIKPLTTDTDSGLFQAWKIALSLANACFIIAFLVIIYSQITSVGINNYEIKKMIPRLIIAAILVNVSYYICSIAVDISNILGNSIQQALVDVRESLPAPKAQTTWGDATEAILSGVTLAGTAYLASAEIIALAPLLVTALIGGILSALIALMVLAARQAIMTVLIVLAPIAFVAYLLPNTEKQFDRWRGLFMNMLMIFPLFSLLFGGSQLASYLIIQNTDQISVVILAMFVQVAPLAITPFLIKISHNLLSQLAGLANNPQKGIMDRTRNWANERSQIMRNDMNARGAGKPFWTPTGIAYRRNKGSLIRQQRLKNGQEKFAAAVANEKRMRDLMAEGKEAELQKNAGEAMAEAQFQRKRAKDKVLQEHSGNLHLAKLKAKAFEEVDEARFQEVLSSRIDPEDKNHAYAAYAVEARKAQHKLHVAEGNKTAAQRRQNIEWMEELKDNIPLQVEVGGIDPDGPLNVYAEAKSADVKRKAELVQKIKDSSQILPGRIHEMDHELRKAINEGNVEKARAYIDMLARSNDPGVHRLRMTLRKFEAKMGENDMIGDIKFHLDNHASLNNEAEDIVKWSRTTNETLGDVGHAAGTWSNQTANKIIGQKMTTQLIALKSGGVNEATMREILLNPAKVGLKPVVIKEIRRQMRLNEDGSEDEWLRTMTPEQKTEYERRTQEPLTDQVVPDPDNGEDYDQSLDVEH